MNEEKKICGAKKVNGQPCRCHPMDNGRCRLHGGRNIDDKRPNLPGRPPTHGMYSKYLKGKIFERSEEFMIDKDFLSLRSEIAIARSLMANFLEKFDEDKVTFDTIESIKALLEQIRKLNDTYVRIETQRKYALSPEEVIRVIKEVALIIREEVKDDEIYKKVQSRVERIKI
ncbi:MAG: hypothetical protein FJ150_08555 [Euryarchaeota archaeon]|nr:hypothetical protein [Euryarchaeota archaeon]